VLEGHGLKHKILVFGIEHTSPQPHIAEYILRERPHAVVVETALTPEHGARPGNTVSCRDRVVEGPGAFFLRMFCQVASALQEEAAAAGGDILATSLWQQVRVGQYRGEQLVYIAALATRSLLVFGDRPKDITYRRLYTVPTLAQLDAGYEAQAAAAYRVMLGEAVPGEMPGRDVAEAGCLVDQILMQEREAVMLSVATSTASGKLPQQCAGSHDVGCDGQGGATQGASAKEGDIVMVVGRAHLPGLKTLWSTDRWRELLGTSGGALEGSRVLTVPPLASVPDKQLGPKRGLLHAVLRLGATDEVLSDLEQTLGPLPDTQRMAYDAVCEIYGVTRVMLSCLPRDLLDKVCQGAPAAEGAGRVDLYAALQPLRDLRPRHGGPGYSEDALTELRALNFDLD